MSLEKRRQAVEYQHPSLSIKHQCELLGISRSGLYYQPKGISERDLTLMKLIDRQYMATPFYGARKLAVWLKSQGHLVNRKRVRRLMEIMGIQAIYRKPRTTRVGPGNRIYPYLLKGLKVDHPNQVWAADITYIPMQKGFLYLVAILDWYSRNILAWRLSNTLDSDFCIEALKEALQFAQPDIFNTDQGSQFTSRDFVALLESQGIRVSMDGAGSYSDNLFIERLWRTLKYEEVYLKAYSDAAEAKKEIGKYFNFYSTQRPHQALNYRTPAEVYQTESIAAVTERMLQSHKSKIRITNVLGMAGFHLNLE